MPPKEPTIFRTLSLIPAIFLLGGIACSTGEPHVLVEEPEAKLSQVMLGVASVFMKIVNSGNGDDRLLSARTDTPGTMTELHDENDGKMRTVTSMDVPANSTLVLGPSGKHIMIFRLARNTAAGTELRMVLTFKRSGERAVTLRLMNSATKDARAHYH